MLRFGSKPQTFNENDWNDQIEQFNRPGQDVNPELVYMLSKLQAEKGEKLPDSEVFLQIAYSEDTAHAVS